MVGFVNTVQSDARSNSEYGPLPTLRLGDKAAAQLHRSGRSFVGQHFRKGKVGRADLHAVRDNRSLQHAERQQYAGSGREAGLDLWGSVPSFIALDWI